MSASSRLFLCRGLSTCALFAVIASLAACGPTCTPGTNSCNGGNLESCPYGSDSEPMVEYCVACKELPSGATCVDSPSPVSACANVANGTGVCWNESPTTCQDGYPTNSAQTPCDQGSVCVVAGGKGFCALSSAPDPICAGVTAPLGAVCDGEDQVACELGYATSRTTCPSGTLCTGSGVCM